MWRRNLSFFIHWFQLFFHWQAYVLWGKSNNNKKWWKVEPCIDNSNMQKSYWHRSRILRELVNSCWYWYWHSLSGLVEFGLNLEIKCQEANTMISFPVHILIPTAHMKKIINLLNRIRLSRRLTIAGHC